MKPFRCNPLHSLSAVRDAAGRLLNDPRFGPARVVRHFGREIEVPYRLPVDVYLTSEDIIVQATLPSLKAQDVDITLNGDQLVIKGRLKAREDNIEYVLHERPYGHFKREVHLPVKVVADQAEATIEKGVLTIALPKAKPAQSNVVHIAADKGKHS